MANQTEVQQVAILNEIFLAPSNSFRTEGEVEAAECTGKCTSGICRTAGL